MYISKQVSDEVILLFPNTKCCLLTFNSFYSSFNVIEVILICFLIHDEIKGGPYFQNSVTKIQS